MWWGHLCTEPIQEKKQKLGQMAHTSAPNAWQVEAGATEAKPILLYNKLVDTQDHVLYLKKEMVEESVHKSKSN